MTDKTCSVGRPTADDTWEKRDFGLNLPLLHFFTFFPAQAQQMHTVKTFLTKHERKKHSHMGLGYFFLIFFVGDLVENLFLKKNVAWDINLLDSNPALQNEIFPSVN